MSLEAAVTIAGVDGCKGGWIAVALKPGGRCEVAVFARLADLLDQLPGDAVVAVDMPIGLPAVTKPGGRGPERLVRPLLGARQSSVFSIPSRAAVYATTASFSTLDAWYEDHRTASAIARATSDPPRGVSIQAFGIFAKIRELDELLRVRPGLADRLIESHPELAFWKLNGTSPLSTPKKIAGRVNSEGMADRRALLLTAGVDASVLDRTPAKGAAADDLFDAAAMLTVAARFSRGDAISFPENAPRDDFGLPIAIRV